MSLPLLPGANNTKCYNGYQALASNTAEIRLLRIQYDENIQDIDCHLYQIPLAEANPFYALSYVWGSETDSTTIILDDQESTVRSNLKQFLQHLCMVLKRPINVWADAVCIDQNNLVERNSQVQMMDQIYKSADAVYAWLGPSTMESDNLFGQLKEARKLREAGARWCEVRDKDEMLAQAYEDVLGRPYWTRLWIIQEIVLAKRLWLLCGIQSLSWEDFSFMQGKLTKVHNTILRNLTTYRHRPQQYQLRELVHSFEKAACQDPRDRIYGLLSMASDRSGVAVDYRKPLLQILMETYQLWVAQWAMDHDISVIDSDSNIAYTPWVYCKQLAVLLPRDQFETYYNTIELRQRVASTVNLKATVCSDAVSCRTLAVFGSAIEPIALRDSQHSYEDQRGQFVILITKENGNHSLAYCTTTILPGDDIAGVGQMFVVIRNCQRSKQSVVGRGIHFENAKSLNGDFPHPCRWATGLLPDSEIKLVQHVAVEPDFGCGRPNRVRNSHQRDIVLQFNAAALIELIAAESETLNEWNLLRFGTLHGILSFCRFCRSQPEPKIVHINAKRCYCVWSGQETVLKSKMERNSIRQHF